jgi:hypothetical protein
VEGTPLRGEVVNSHSTAEIEEDINSLLGLVGAGNSSTSWFAFGHAISEVSGVEAGSFGGLFQSHGDSVDDWASPYQCACACLQHVLEIGR